MKKCVLSPLFVFVMFLLTANPAASSSSSSCSSSNEPLLSRKIIQLFHDYGAETFTTSDNPVVVKFIGHFEKIKSFLIDHNAKYDSCRRFNMPMTVRILSHEHAHNTKIVRIVKIDHKSFVTLSLGGEVKVWTGDPRVNDWYWVADLVDRAYVCTVAALNSQTIVTGGHGGYLVLWQQDAESDEWKKVSQLVGHTHAILGIAVVDEDTIVTAGSEGTVRIWQRVLGSCMWQTAQTLSNTDRLASIAALDKNTFLTGHKANGLIKVWSRDDSQSSWRNSDMLRCGHDYSIQSFEKIDNGAFVAASYTNQRMFYWKKNDDERGWHISKMSTKRDEFTGCGLMRDAICSWMPFDENTLVVGYSSGIPRVWQFPSAQEIALRIALCGLSEELMQTIYDELMDLR